MVTTTTFSLEVFVGGRRETLVSLAFVRGCSTREAFKPQLEKA